MVPWRLQDKAPTPWEGLASQPSAPCSAVLLQEPTEPFHSSGFCTFFLCLRCSSTPWSTWDISYSSLTFQPKASSSGKPSLISSGRTCTHFSRHLPLCSNHPFACCGRWPLVGWLSMTPASWYFSICNTLPLSVD